MGRRKGKEGERRQKGVKEVEGEEKEREGRKKGRKKEEEREGKGEGRDGTTNLTFWYKLTPMSVREGYQGFGPRHKRRIGLTTRNQSALFMMSIN